MRFFKKRYILILIFLLAFILRLVFVLQSSEIPSSDASVYDRLGLSISEGQGYVNNRGTPHCHYPPFYPFFLSIIYTLFGHSYTAVRIFQSVLGAFSCVLVYLIGKRMFTVSVGAVASFISIVYFPFIKSAELLLSELVFTFLLLLIVFYLLKIQENMNFRDSIILGLLSGIALLTRSMAILLPLFILPVFIYSRKGGLLYILKRYIVVLLFFCLTMAPWLIRNYNIHHRFVPTSVEGGMTLWMSYFPTKGVFGINSTREDPVVAESYKIKDPVLRNRFLVKKIIDFIWNNPKEILALELKKVLYFWAPFDWEIVGGRWFNFEYVAMLPFIAIGIFLAIKGFRKNYPVLLPIIYFQIMALIFYGSPRFRLPIEPFIFILAATGILQCYKWMFDKRREVRE